MTQPYGLALSIEAAEKDTKHLRANSGNQPQHVLYNQGSSRGRGSAPPLRHGAATGKSCYRCGGNHLAPTCRHKDTECAYRKKKARVCLSKKRSQEGTGKAQPKKNLYVSEDDSTDVYDLYAIQDHSNSATVVQVRINGAPVELIHDTGASRTIVNIATFRRIQHVDSSVTLRSSNARLHTYTGELLPVLGSADVSVSYDTNATEVALSVIVVDGAGPNLMGRDWMAALNRPEVTPEQVNLVNPDKLNAVLNKHKAVFDGSLGCLKDVKVNMTARENAKPKFWKPRTVPLLLRDKVDQELDRLEQSGIISPVQHSQWAAPIVPVPKKDGTVRICGDFKTTVNQVCHTEQYPLPRADELFSDLCGGKYFTKLDLSRPRLGHP